MFKNIGFNNGGLNNVFKRKPVESKSPEEKVYAVEATNLTKIYQRRWIAVNSISLEIPKGAIFGLVGPNGAGKSTTLRLILGLHHATAGGERSSVRL